ncbi:MAG: hypothetical protein M1833_004061 [Piccolia ochrophora]|nr:MAG: hypothetical protein M1833_004061 [Piccolia ochrophora]
MAIFPNRRPSAAQPTPTQPLPSAAQVEAWAEQATEALQGVSLSSTTPSPLIIRGTSVSLAIPLDDRSPTHPAADSALHNPSSAETYSRRRREPFRRDSLKRREALLKGKEGSRRRQRWENDRLLSNPYVQPPLPSDWEIHPTYPRHATVPYYLAPLWDAELSHRSSAAKADAQHQQTQQHSRVPRELRDKLKRARSARGMLQDFEGEIRRFVEGWEATPASPDHEASPPSSEDEEIVFVGRNGQMSDSRPPRSPKAKAVSTDPSREDVAREKLVFDALADDRAASFGRFLVHSIAAYYGLRAWSVTVGDPARREAYVGIPEVARGKRGDGKRALKGYGVVGNGKGEGLPRPLWGMV